MPVQVFHKDDGERYMIRATKAEWVDILDDLRAAHEEFGLTPTSFDIIMKLKAFGVEA